MTTTVAPAPRLAGLLARVAARLVPATPVHPAAGLVDAIGTPERQAAALTSLTAYPTGQACDDCTTCACGQPAVAADHVTDLGYCAAHLLAAPTLRDLRLHAEKAEGDDSAPLPEPMEWANETSADDIGHDPYSAEARAMGAEGAFGPADMDDSPRER